MSIFVAGLVNVETTLRIERFPLTYSPVHYPFFGVNATVSGVGYNIAKALTTLGQTVALAGLIGLDAAGLMVRAACAEDEISDLHLLSRISHTPQSVILYDKDGQRQIHVDLKDIQEQTYPLDRARALMSACELSVLSNVNFTRALLPVAQKLGTLIATDVHAISRIDDEYNADYMTAADILFMSHESLPCSPEDWVRQLWDTYQTDIAVVGLGAEGCLLAVREEAFIGRFPAQSPRPVVNTIGAGDALFSSFLHSYLETRDPQLAIRRAAYFAGWKVGENGAARGFLSAAQLVQRTVE
jgi:ribokinase